MTPLREMVRLAQGHRVSGKRLLPSAESSFVYRQAQCPPGQGHGLVCVYPVRAVSSLLAHGKHHMSLLDNNVFLEMQGSQ